MKKLMKYLKNEEGLVAIEYGLIAALVAVVIIVVVRALGVQLVAVFQAVVDALAAALT